MTKRREFLRALRHFAFLISAVAIGVVVGVAGAASGGHFLPALFCVGATIGLLLLLLRRVVLSVALGFGLAGTIVAASAIKSSYLGSPLTAADLRFFLADFSVNAELFRSYPSLLALALAVALLLAASTWVGWRTERPMPARSMLSRRSLSFFWVPLGVLGILFSTYGSPAPTVVGPDDDPFAAEWVRESLTWNSSAIASLVRWTLLPANWSWRIHAFFDESTVTISMPERILVRHKFVPPALPGKPDAAAHAVLPDILLVLEESTFNPVLVTPQRKWRERNGLFDPHLWGSRSEAGPLLVSIVGGGTWLSELAIMSGLDWRLFGHAGKYAPVSIAPRLRESLPRYLRSIGYRTVAVYPVKGNFLNAAQAYRSYGFDEFHASEALALESQNWTELRDGTIFDRALSILGRSEDHRPVFAFVLTIRNHGPHGEGPMIPVGPPTEAVYDSALQDYLARMRDSGDDYASLRTRWLGSQRPRVLAWFGDHQPAFSVDWLEHHAVASGSGLPANVDPSMAARVTAYLLEANFGRPGNNQRVGAMDITYFGATLLRFAGVPLNASLASAQELDGRCNGMLVECRDAELVKEYVSYRVYELGELK